MISESADKNGISPESIEEIEAPNFGMEKSGELKITLGEYVGWFEKNGKFQSSIPAAIKQNFSSELKTIKTDTKINRRTIKGTFRTPGKHIFKAPSKEFYGLEGIIYRSSPAKHYRQKANMAI